MPVNYSEGVFVLYSAPPERRVIGWIKNGYVGPGNLQWDLQVKGQEIYGAFGDLVARIEGGVASEVDGRFLFSIEPDV